LTVIEQESTYRFAEVVFPIAVDHPFTYLIPAKFAQDIVPGIRVLVPFGPRKITGFVVGGKNESRLKEHKAIEEVLDPIPLFTEEVLAAAKWIADYYMCGWGEVLKAALPAGIHLSSQKAVRLVHTDPRQILAHIGKKAPRQAQIVKLLMDKNPLTIRELERELKAKQPYQSLKNLAEQGIIRFELALPRPKTSKKFETFVKINPAHIQDNLEQIIETLSPKAPKQAQCLKTMIAFPGKDFTRPELARLAKADGSAINKLIDRGILYVSEEEVYRDYYAGKKVEPPPHIVLNPHQATALNRIRQQIDSGDFGAFLLHGVTGSGKTQVYIEAIHHTLAKGKTAIVLVPEIALTPQMVSRFRSHFGDKVAVFHSRMSPGERYDSWRRTWEGLHRIVIGPRSAIFAPLKNIGLIAVDEEHETSYKQHDLTPRYNARDVAIVRANISKAVVVLGSATPALESYFNAQEGKYELLTLPQRIDNIEMPEITIQDMLKEPRIIGRKEPVIISRLMRQKIDEKLAKGEQIILFLNRRGFATLLKCKDCTYVAKCRNCDITLTYHIRGKILKCHYCGYIKRAPDYCPECHGVDIFFKGVGTQRVEEELHRLFPGVSAVRMDLDTTRGKWSHDRILSQFGRGEYNILLGTQMVAKGLDFPNVTLVGVISADTELYFPDFRSSERTFQLLTQVAGRAGRKNKKGEVVIQTYSPDHFSILCAKTHDYHRFVEKELADRRVLGYPPYSRMVNVLFRGENQSSVEKVAQLVASFIRKQQGIKVLGPAPSPISRIKGNYRWQILFMSLKQTDLGGRGMKDAIRAAFEAFKEKHRAYKVHISLDVDPLSIL